VDNTGPVVQEFAEHLAADVKQLVENEETGEQSYRYVRTGADHYSLAFSYDCVAWCEEARWGDCRVVIGTADDDDYDDPRRPPWERKKRESMLFCKF
jgi:hypothetical protein